MRRPDYGRPECAISYVRSRYRLVKLAPEWVAGQGATDHTVYPGTAVDSLTLVSTISKTPLEAPELKPLIS